MERASGGPAGDGQADGGARALAVADDEAPARRLAGWAGRAGSVLAAGLALYSVWWALAVVETRFYRTSFLLVALLLAFLLYPARRARGRSGEPPGGRVSPTDSASFTAAREARGVPVTPPRKSGVGAGPSGASDAAGGASVTSPREAGLGLGDFIALGLTLVALGWPLVAAGFADRVATPTWPDLACGAAATLLVLEATRRAIGWVLPATAAAFIVYAFAGPWLDALGLSLVAHRGYNLSRVVGTLYMGLDGLFGVPLDVAATYVVLFALYAAVLDAAGASRFFLDFTFAVFGRRGGGAAPARTVTAAGFLLGTVSGSGVATTVALGAPGWPLLKRAGYPPETAGAILSAAGIGAILSPPTLGAAAFLIAEFLKVPYLQILVMVTLPTVLYYLAVLLMAEAEARTLGLAAGAGPATSAAALVRRGGLHFVSLVAVAALMLAGLTPFRAVLWAALLAVLTSFVAGAGTPLGPRRLAAACAQGGRAAVAVTATTATAGIIVGVTALTGLGLKAAGLIVSLAGGSLILTVVFAALAVWVIGLAVPVTASYVLAAVMIAPALTQVGVPDVAAHLFIFYYAVLSEVSPPTALAPMAAAALTGADPFRTVLHTWRYTLPAFLVPFAFTASPEGLGLLLRAPPRDVLHAGLTAALGVAALAAGLGGFMRAPASRLERGLAAAGGLLLVLGGWRADVAGALLVAVALVRHGVRTRRALPHAAP